MTSIFSRPNRLTAEQAIIRQQLKLRFNRELNSWEVFTTKHGSDSRNMIFRWYLISEESARWYLLQKWYLNHAQHAQAYNASHALET